MKKMPLPQIVFLVVFIAMQLRADEPHPNLIFILADDLGHADLECSGSDFYLTPNINRLAKEGMIFTQSYASAPVCLPTRAAFMTGKTPARLNMTAVFDRDGGKMPL